MWIHNQSLAFIIGSDTAKSFSPLIWNYWFQKFGIDILYDYSTVMRSKSVVNDLFGGFMHKLKTRSSLVFFNVTTPYKSSVINHIDFCSDRAREVGAVNAVIVKDGDWYGENHDGWGFIRGLNIKKPNFDYENSKILILGTGAVSTAVILSLLDEGAKHIYVMSRSKDKAVELCERFSLLGAYSLDKMFELLPEIDLLFNGTVLSSQQMGLDNPNLVYDPNYWNGYCGKSADGATDGLWMLIYQAHKALKEFFNVDPGSHDELFKLLLGLLQSR